MDLMMIPVTGVLVGAVVWGFAFWWFGRKLRSAGERLAKLEAVRQQLNTQVSQARRQVEQLQKDIAELRMGHGPGSQARSTASVPAASARPSAAPEAPAGPGDGFAQTQILPGGFAHTQLQPRKV